jgi:trk system potassium uptake protein TrkA
MQILIVGAGEVGYHLAEILSKARHRVSVIDPDPAKVLRLQESLDVQVLVGDGTDAEVLTRGGAANAELALAVTDNDTTNMLACVILRNLGAQRVILRLKDTRRIASFYYFFKRSLGFEAALSTEDLAGQEIVATVRDRHALEVETFASGRVHLRRLRLARENELTQAPLEDLRLPERARIAAIVRGERLSLPKPEDQLAVGDQIYVLGAPTDVDQLEAIVEGAPTGRRTVILMGGTNLSCQVARDLAGTQGVSVRIIERDAERAREIAPQLDSSCTVLHGDATDLDVLLQERIGEANVFVATTRDDENNMVACQLARSLGVQRTVAIVNKSSYRQIYDLLGVDLAISPRILMASRILRFVRSMAVSAVAVVAEGRAELVELEAHFRGARNERRIKALGLPDDVLVGTIVRGEEVIVPDEDFVIEEGDQVILLGLPERVAAVERVFARGLSKRNEAEEDARE